MCEEEVGLKDCGESGSYLKSQGNRDLEKLIGQRVRACGVDAGCPDCAVMTVVSVEVLPPPPLIYVQGSVLGYILDACGEFRIEPEEGTDRYVSMWCSTGSWEVWKSLVFRHIGAWGYCKWKQCGWGPGEAFCVTEIDSTATEVEGRTWGRVKAAYR
jgi:hypothetical protein